MIENVVEDFFTEYLEEGYEVEDLEFIICESLDTSIDILNEAKVTYGHDTKNKSNKLEKVKTAVKKVARGVGKVVGAAARGAKTIGREVKAGYSSGSRGEQQSQQKSERKPGLLSRIGAKLKSGLKTTVARGARKVAKGALGVARKVEGSDKKPSSAHSTPGTRTAKTYRGSGVGSVEKAGSAKPKLEPKKAEKPSDPWEGSATTPTKPKAKTKKAPAPKAKAPAAAKKKRKSKLDSLLSDIRSEETQLSEKTLTSAETKEKERIVKSMKDKSSDFEKRYPGRGKEVMYATATKIAKKIAEQAMELQPKTQSKEKPLDTAIERQKYMNMKMLQQKQQQMQKQKLNLQKQGKLPLEVD